MSILQNKALLASMGVATATATTFAGFAPTVVATAGAVDGDDTSNVIAADPVTDGTYESCSAYFGYGKGGEEEEPLELTTFPVTVQGGTPDGPAPTVGNGAIDVVLVLEDVNGDELRCVPEQVTEQEWDDTWGGAPFDLPAYPGPGHYVYPSVLGIAGPVAFQPTAIDGLDDLESVSFEVVGVPEGYTLVDPTGTSLLPQAFAAVFESLFAGDPSPFVVAYIAGAAGADAATAYGEAWDYCFDQSGSAVPPNSSDPALVAAVQSLADLAESEPPVYTAPINCDIVFDVTFPALFVLAVQATIDTESPITVSLPVPDEPTTTTTPTTAPPAAEPAVVTPSFTG